MHPKTSDALHALLDIVKAEFASDPEPEDLPSWSEAIKLAEKALIEDESSDVFDLALGNLRAQHQAYLANKKLRVALKECRTFFLDDYMSTMIDKALEPGELPNPLPRRFEAAYIVAHNWRIRTRLPRITALAVKLGLIEKERKP